MTEAVKGIKDYDLDELAGLLESLGEPRYRVGQVARWLYGRGAESYGEMTDLPEALRVSLAKAAPLHTPQTMTRRVSAIDGTRKYLFGFADSSSVEAVGLPTGDRLTVCFSTQVGCAMGCTFCATGMGGFTRDLTPGEMVDQVRLVGLDFGQRVTNAVAMGQGEPFANYSATLGALRIMNSPDGLGIGARHLTVSTCGILAGIRRLAQEPEQFTLAVSLHSAVPATRNKLMPGVRGVRLEDLQIALDAYSASTGRRPSLEYALIDGVNDTDSELSALVSFTRGRMVHVNLIPANPVAGSELARSSESRARAFMRQLADAGVESSLRSERGADIEAACGQLKQLSVNTNPG